MIRFNLPTPTVSRSRSSTVTGVWFDASPTSIANAFMCVHNGERPLFLVPEHMLVDAKKCSRITALYDFIVPLDTFAGNYILNLRRAAQMDMCRAPTRQQIRAELGLAPPLPEHAEREAAPDWRQHVCATSLLVSQHSVAKTTSRLACRDEAVVRLIVSMPDWQFDATTGINLASWAWRADVHRVVYDHRMRDVRPTQGTPDNVFTTIGVASHDEARHIADILEPPPAPLAAEVMFS